MKNNLNINPLLCLKNKQRNRSAQVLYSSDLILTIYSKTPAILSNPHFKLLKVIIIKERVWLKAKQVTKDLNKILIKSKMILKKTFNLIISTKCLMFKLKQ